MPTDSETLGSQDIRGTSFLIWLHIRENRHFPGQAPPVTCKVPLREPVTSPQHPLLHIHPFHGQAPPVEYRMPTCSLKIK